MTNLHLFQTVLSINDLYDALEWKDVSASWAAVMQKDAEKD